MSQVGFSLPVKIIAQLIVFNHKKERTRKPTHGHHRNVDEKETLFVQYIGLKMYATVRSKNIIATLFQHGYLYLMTEYCV